MIFFRQKLKFVSANDEKNSWKTDTCFAKRLNSFSKKIRKLRQMFNIFAENHLFASKWPAEHKTFHIFFLNDIPGVYMKKKNVFRILNFHLARIWLHPIPSKMFIGNEFSLALFPKLF